MHAATSDADDERRRALSEFGILGSPFERSFDDLTCLAARLCSTPVATVALVDGDRMWFKSRWGITDTSTARELSFCQYLLDEPGTLVVPDARADPRFRENPLVADGVELRFYAGASLTLADGVTVGALCVLDAEPRTMRPGQMDDLQMVGRQVVAQLELRRQAARLRAEMAATARAQSELHASRQLLDEVLAHTDVLIYATDLAGRFILANAAMREVVGVRDGELIGRLAHDVLPADAVERFARNGAATLAAGTWQVYTEELIGADGVVHTYRSTKFPLVDHSGTVHAIGGVSTDVTEAISVRTEMLESERRFRALFDHSPIAIGLSDEDGLWITANESAGRLFGVDPALLVGRSSLEFIDPDDAPEVAAAERSQFDAPRSVGEAEIRVRRDDGTVRWAWLKLTPVSGPQGEKWTLGMAHDVTDRKAMEDDLRRSEEELAAVAAVARCVQSGTDPRPVVVESVRSLAGAVAVRLLEPVDARSLRVTAAVPEDPSAEPVPATAASVRSTGRAVLEQSAGSAGSAGSAVLWQPVVVEGEVIAVLQVVWDRSVAHTPNRAVEAVRMLSGETGASLHAAQLRAELERSAGTDPLTGALNRRAWDHRLLQEMEAADRSGRPLTIAIIDLDNFKSFNDSFGHAAGDELLRTFAADVRAELDGTGVFARWGGEEFILALPDCDARRAGELLDRISDAVPGRQTCSIGHAVWVPGEPVVACVGRADDALYVAKAAGRDRVVAG